MKKGGQKAVGKHGPISLKSDGDVAQIASFTFTVLRKSRCLNIFDCHPTVQSSISLKFS